MKAIEWQQFLQQQRDAYGKVTFTPTELANIAGHSGPVLKTTLHRLSARGVLQRYTSGRYGLPGAATMDDLVASIDSGAYITGMAALHRHCLITQTPQRVLAFTNRRHNRSRLRRTALGRLAFTCVKKPVYARPDESVVAGPEQALCDYAYALRRKGLSLMGLVTFRNLHRLDPDALETHLSRYPRSVEKEIRRLLSFAAGQAPAG